MKKIDGQINQQEVLCILKKFDKNNDGTIELKEFQTLINEVHIYIINIFLFFFIYNQRMMIYFNY